MQRKFIIKKIYLMGKKPDFLIIGAQKCGTTSIDYNLNKHPEIYMSEYSQGSGSEMHFFDRDKTYANGLSWYESHFIKDKICGEKTPEYMTEELYIQRIKKDLPNVKLIIALRNPINRFFSQMNMRIKLGRVIDIDKILNNKGLEKEYLHRGLYYKQIEIVLKYFNKDQIHIIILDDENIDRINLKQKDKISSGGFIQKDNSNLTNTIMKNLFTFLNVTPIQLDWNQLFISDYVIKVSNSDLRKIKEYYDKDNEELFNFLGYKIRSWI